MELDPRNDDWDAVLHSFLGDSVTFLDLTSDLVCRRFGSGWLRFWLPSQAGVIGKQRAILDTHSAVA